MKKNISVLLIAMILLGLFLAACGGGGGSSGGPGSTALVGTWANDNGDTFTFTAEGKYSTSSGLEGSYTYDGSTLALGEADGSTSKLQTKVEGDTMTVTGPDGSSVTWTKQ